MSSPSQTQSHCPTCRTPADDELVEDRQDELVDIGLDTLALVELILERLQGLESLVNRETPSPSSSSPLEKSEIP